MMDEKDQLWAYFTLLGGSSGHNCIKDTGGTRMITFYTIKGAQNGEKPVSPMEVQKAALAAAPFKLARNHWHVMVSFVIV
jgi:hypothetical protein